jgi:hypothetical protein
VRTDGKVAGREADRSAHSAQLSFERTEKLQVKSLLIDRGRADCHSCPVIAHGASQRCALEDRLQALSHPIGNPHHLNPVFSQLVQAYHQSLTLPACTSPRHPSHRLPSTPIHLVFGARYPAQKKQLQFHCRGSA